MNADSRYAACRIEQAPDSSSDDGGGDDGDGSSDGGGGGGGGASRRGAARKAAAGKAEPRGFLVGLGTHSDPRLRALGEFIVESGARGEVDMAGWSMREYIRKEGALAGKK